MGYLVLARKWRPQGFEDLAGQASIATILTNSIEQDKVAHAYVFSGPRGVGKTSTARILSKALNCEHGPTATPCGKCGFCTSITDGSSMDVMEIDGASNNSVDDIRELREKIKYAPSGGRFKVYIIDESHMLSPSAFNALLKTIEEPPPHVIFVLATTAPHKIPLTVLSRCQHLPFRRIPARLIRERVEHICKDEKIEITDGALDLIASTADGSMRDSLTILDQAASFSASVDETSLKDLLGLSDLKELAALAEALIEGNRERILTSLAALADEGTDMKSFAKEFMKFMRDLLVAKVTTKPEEVLELAEDALETVKRITEGVPEETLTLLLGEAVRAEQEVRTAFSPRLAFEMALIRASYLSALTPVNEALKRIELFTKDARIPPPASAGQESRETTSPPSSTSPPSLSEPKQDYEGGAAEANAKGLFKYIIENLEDPRTAAKLSTAVAELDGGGTLTLYLNSPEAALFKDELAENTPLIEALATKAADRPITVKLGIRHTKSQGKKQIKEQILAEPVIRKALELFNGRVVDVKPVNDV